MRCCMLIIACSMYVYLSGALSWRSTPTSCTIGGLTRFGSSIDSKISECVRIERSSGLSL